MICSRLNARANHRLLSHRLDNFKRNYLICDLTVDDSETFFLFFFFGPSVFFFIFFLSFPFSLLRKTYIPIDIKFTRLRINLIRSREKFCLETRHFFALRAFRCPSKASREAQIAAQRKRVVKSRLRYRSPPPPPPKAYRPCLAHTRVRVGVRTYAVFAP